MKSLLMFVPNGPINNIRPGAIQAPRNYLDQWHQPLPDPIVVSIPTHLSGTRPQWI